MAFVVPPGRAGRLWLVNRIELARRAADLLATKERLLRDEHRRLLAARAATERAWFDSCRQAGLWAARAAVLGGQRDLTAGIAPPAEVTVTWSSRMGLDCPGEVQVIMADTATRATNPALAGAVEAARRAVSAAVAHAASDFAYRRVEQELASTRRRRRAINDRWLPRLNRSLAELAERLEELEREEHVRVRWAQGRGATGAQPASAARADIR